MISVRPLVGRVEHSMIDVVQMGHLVAVWDARPEERQHFRELPQDVRPARADDCRDDLSQKLRRIDVQFPDDVERLAINQFW